jgi:hypothetical protein
MLRGLKIIKYIKKQYNSDQIQFLPASYKIWFLEVCLHLMFPQESNDTECVARQLATL